MYLFSGRYIWNSHPKQCFTDYEHTRRPRAGFGLIILFISLVLQTRSFRKLPELLKLKLFVQLSNCQKDAEKVSTSDSVKLDRYLSPVQVCKTYKNVKKKQSLPMIS